MDFVRAAIVLLLLVAVGCSGDVAPVKVEPPAPPPASDAAKAILTSVVETGELGSGTEELKTVLDGMKTTDAAKADGLLKDLADLEKSRTPEEAKSKAQAMLRKL
jgi:hypothetical protein